LATNQTSSVSFLYLCSQITPASCKLPPFLLCSRHLFS
jgi:hypothetical protein